MNNIDTTKTECGALPHTPAAHQTAGSERMTCSELVTVQAALDKEIVKMREYAEFDKDGYWKLKIEETQALKVKLAVSGSGVQTARATRTLHRA